MADHILREVQRMHQLRRDVNEMAPEQAEELIGRLGDDAAEDRVFAARDAQLPSENPIGAGCFLAAEAPANSTQCRRRCIPQCALG